MMPIYPIDADWYHLVIVYVAGMKSRAFVVRF
jgi:hypothetical protein